MFLGLQYLFDQVVILQVQYKSFIYNFCVSATKCVLIQSYISTLFVFGQKSLACFANELLIFFASDDSQ